MTSGDLTSECGPGERTTRVSDGASDITIQLPYTHITRFTSAKAVCKIEGVSIGRESSKARS